MKVSEFKLGLSLFLALLLLFLTIPFSLFTPIGQAKTLEQYSAEAQGYIKAYDLKLYSSNGYELSESYLLDQNGVGENLVVYGDPEDVNADYDDYGRPRYFGFDINGNPFTNWKFSNDATATRSVDKNWIQYPWNGKVPRIKDSVHNKNPKGEVATESIYIKFAIACESV